MQCLLLQAKLSSSKPNLWTLKNQNLDTIPKWSKYENRKLSLGLNKLWIKIKKIYSYWHLVLKYLCCNKIQNNTLSKLFIRQYYCIFRYTKYSMIHMKRFALNIELLCISLLKCIFRNDIIYNNVNKGCNLWTLEV